MQAAMKRNLTHSPERQLLSRSKRQVHVSIFAAMMLALLFGMPDGHCSMHRELLQVRHD